MKTKYIRLDYVSLSGATNLSDCELNCTRNRDCLGFMFKYDGRGSCVLKNKNDSDNWLVNGFWSPETESAMFRDDLTTGVRYQNLFDVVVDVVI
ncbi:hypothetical protein G4B88_010177 [Cannabis sativa]|uniref:Apple domain-containing protein n=1 Tax=Cannabis sativa TaxID=3483 RepID=A0A7J6E2Y7_CANSA|nr:hypothetical protein G4B88_010177 [Cannabis sativa]